jgi:hypothetical protein
MKRTVFYYMLALALTATACKKGDPGPKGDKGDKGDTGATGANGAAGSKGDPGTANVMYSNWLDLSFSLDTASAVYFTQISEAKVTDNFLSTGEIKVYVNLGPSDSKVVSPLPYSEGGARITPYYAAGTIEIDANVDASTVTSSTNGKKYRQYRYILIPGGASLRMGKQINWNNYEEVKAYLGLKD